MGVLGGPVCALCPKPCAGSTWTISSPEELPFTTDPMPAHLGLLQPAEVYREPTTKTKSPAHRHLPQVVPPSFSPYTYQPTDTPPNLANWLKRGSIRKKLRRGQSLMAPFSTLRSHTLRPLYSLLVFPSLFPRIARMICSEQRQVYRLADTSALWNFN